MLGLGTGSLTFVEGYAADVLALTNGGDARDRVLVVTNFGDTPVELPEGVEVVVASGPLEDGSGAAGHDGLGPLGLTKDVLPEGIPLSGVPSGHSCGQRTRRLGELS